eukprot:TRINITY_DN411_c0_g1_i2.p1 TRINITY_DN411_c0_g1~~TRINITY_DN411_c0_g1_i2.p1  ORF type:complete len:215 (-),score=38.21 TRINITY_DN411_c0_g1_i2:502-1146(-)
MGAVCDEAALLALKEGYGMINGEAACPEETFVNCDIKVIDDNSPVRSTVGGDKTSTGDSARTEQLIMNESVEAGVLLCRVTYKGHTIATRYWNTIEVGPVGDGSKIHANLGHKFLKANHSFSPNSIILMDYERQCMEWWSITRIEAGTAISWDYTTTEWEMDECFTDWESGKACQGFKHLSREDQLKQLVSGHTSPHVYSHYCRDNLITEKKKH